MRTCPPKKLAAVFTLGAFLLQFSGQPLVFAAAVQIKSAPAVFVPGSASAAGAFSASAPQLVSLPHMTLPLAPAALTTPQIPGSFSAHGLRASAGFSAAESPSSVAPSALSGSGQANAAAQVSARASALAPGSQANTALPSSVLPLSQAHIQGASQDLDGAEAGFETPGGETAPAVKTKTGAGVMKTLARLGAGVSAFVQAVRGRDFNLGTAQTAGEKAFDGSGSRASGSAVPADADQDLLPDERNSIAVFKKAAPSVVFVTNLATGRRSFFSSGEEVPQGTGSGFIWDNDGHIVTNFHVVQNGDSFMIGLQDGTELKARLVGVDPSKDIAVLKVDESLDKLVPIQPGSSAGLQVGQKTVAIGAPFGLDHTMTTGIVSALGRQLEGIGGVAIRDMIQTDASINPGNSGGPLLDSRGRLIGMNTMILGGGTSAGVGFAVPADSIKRIVPDLIKFGRPRQPSMGLLTLTEREKRSLGASDLPGVIVLQVLPGSPADQAGLNGLTEGRRGGYVLGDVITAIDGKAVADYDELYTALDSKKIGDTVTIRFIRDRQEHSVKIKLGSSADMARAGGRAAGRLVGSR